MPVQEIERIRQVYRDYERLGRWEDQNAAYELMIRQRDQTLRRILLNDLGRPLLHCRALEVGCGNGNLLAWLNECGIPSSALCGIDLIPNHIETAKRNYPRYTFQEGNAERLSFPDASFDIVLVATVFSSVLDNSTAQNIAREIARVLKGKGVVGWYDIRYPNPWNRNVRAMTKSRIRELFPDFTMELETTTLLPPLAYRLGRRAEKLYGPLSRIPILRSHLIGLLRGPDKMAG